ncbi:ECF transporter S component [Thermobifida alba]|uniref:ECF transporter S component n=1 Tax=Thermobifida alba TaxID=53522 RepID=A0ABY4L6I6_THEAE|nr:ECF transporter S component [Thermobifida alba]UPT23084.1 ECF transporter S component [Thermobifida alba]HLU96714.1 ECF transporter S component [Thermobifida alba]
MTSPAAPRPGHDRTTPLHWRTVDIVVSAVIGVAVGLVFWLWSALWSATTGLFAFFPPAQAVLYGMWLVPGVLGGLVIRKPGAALLTSLAAASLEMLLGTGWGVSVLVSGALQGLLSELTFLAFRYRHWGMGVAVLAGVAGGISPAIRDNLTSHITWPLSHQVTYGVIVLISAGVIAGAGSRLLTTRLAAAGALAPFPSARG